MKDALHISEPMTREEKIRYIADYYGLKEQLAQTREECAELIQATSKYDRSKTGLDLIRAEEKIAEEMADVTIMLAQLEYLLKNHVEVGYNIQRKLDRQIKRIRDEQSADTENTGS